MPRISRKPGNLRKRKRTRPRTERPITRRAEARIRKLIENPPPGSAIEQAKEFGVDLYINLENLKLAPSERFRRGDDNRRFVQRLREAGRKAGL